MPNDFDRDFLLKAVQAWLDLKLKIAGFAALANGAAIATAASILKDQETSYPAFYALRTATVGLTAGSLAIVVIALLGESVLERMIASASAKGKKIDAAALAHPVTSVFIWLCIAVSGMAFVGGIAFLQGWTEGALSHKFDSNTVITQPLGRAEKQVPQK